MSDNRDLVIKFYKTFDLGDFKIVRNMMAENFAAHLVGIPATLDRDEFIEFGSKFRQAFPDVSHQFDRPICEDDKVVTSGVFTGTHLGNFQGLPATGQSISIAVIHIDSRSETLRERISDGKIVEHWGQGDQAGMMQQLGIVPLPGVSLFYRAIRQRLGMNK
jgi:steroid delta-isomerase-like uncharacterized protein